MSQKIFIYDEKSPITFNDGNGLFVSATEMAKAFGKRPINWLDLSSTKGFLSELGKVRNSDFENMVRTERGGSTPGTWFSEDVALEFARWLSPSFAIWCNDRINELLKIGVTAINPEDLLTPDNMIRAMNALKESRAEVKLKNEQLQLASQTIALQAPKAEYYDNVLQSGSLLTTNIIAADLGMGVRKLYEKLQEAKILYKQSNTYLLTTDYRNKGLADYKTYTYNDSNNKPQTKQHLYWTEAGRQFIISRFAQ
jgi:phage antirepressor YoqD-like protein